MRLFSTFGPIALLAILVQFASAQTNSSSPQGNAYVIDRCWIKPIEHAQVPAREAGVLMALEVRDGMKVKAGQLLAQVADDKPKHQLELATYEHQAAKIQAENDIDLKVAKKAAELTKIDYEDAAFARQRAPDSISNFEFRRKRFTWERQVFEVEQATRDHDVAALNENVAQQKVLVAQNEIDRRKVNAPFAGVIDETFKTVGEWVSPGEPIAYLVNMDKLRVQGYVNADHFAAHELYGQTVTVEVILSGDDITQQERVERFTCKINYVSPTVDPSLGQFRVYAEFDNRQSREGYYIVRPGLPARMILNAPTATATTATSRR